MEFILIMLSRSNSFLRKVLSARKKPSQHKNIELQYRRIILIGQWNKTNKTNLQSKNRFSNYKKHRFLNLNCKELAQTFWMLLEQVANPSNSSSMMIWRKNSLTNIKKCKRKDNHLEMLLINKNLLKILKQVLLLNRLDNNSYKTFWVRRISSKLNKLSKANIPTTVELMEMEMVSLDLMGQLIWIIQRLLRIWMYISQLLL